MRRELERIELPGEHEARERAWALAQVAFAAREPVAPRRRIVRPALVLAVLGAAVAGALSSPGRAVLGDVRDAVLPTRVERAQPALFAIPGGGQLLVASDRGLWTVQPDGSKRRLGDYAGGAWSPHGIYVAATRANALFALTPKGEERWSLSRKDVAAPAWTGDRADTRVAYRARSGARVVGGDGLGDRAACADSTGSAAPVWRPGAGFVLAFAAPDGSIQVYETERCRRLWRTAPGPRPAKLAWSEDGTLLLALSPHRLRVYDSRGQVVAQDDPSDETVDADAAFLPGSHAVAVIRVAGAQSHVFVLDGGRTLFRGTGRFAQLLAAPGGGRLLVTWPTADQWVFVPLGRGGRLRAISNVSAQFRSQSFPRIEGWCCGS